jgi:hypothetical protein
VRVADQAERLAPGAGATIGQTSAPPRTGFARCGVVQGPHHMADWLPEPVAVPMHGLGGPGHG